MRIMISLALAFLFTGCAHVKEVAWQGDQIELCGNKHAGPEDFNSAAQNACGGAFKEVGGGYQTAGFATMPAGYGFYSIPISRTCVVYQCLRQ